MADLTEARLDYLAEEAQDGTGFLHLDTASALELIAAAREGLAAQWRPIETAPKDGTPILISEGTEVHLVSWRQKSSEYGTWTMGGVSGFNATHWMPLPNPPEDRDNG